MKKNNISGRWIASIPFLLLLVFVIVIVLSFLFIYPSFSPINQTNKESLEIVVARYNEELEWLKKLPFHQYPVFVYNKGPNENFYHAPNIMETVPVKNVGRCDHTYLYHIITHYDRLADITIFLPGSLNIENKFNKAKGQILECTNHKNTVFFNDSDYDSREIKEYLYDYQIDEWVATDNQNHLLNPEQNLLPAEIRPFGKWYEARFPDTSIKHISYFGILGIHKKHILQHPKSYYENLIREMNTHSNPEAGHYFERSWAAVFHPMTDAVFINIQNYCETYGKTYTNHN